MSAPLEPKIPGVAPAGAERAAEFVELAHRYADLGWALIRCDGKEPKDNGWQTTQPQSAEFVAAKWSHWGQRWNVGVVCGASGVAVLDVDRDNADAACLELLGADELPSTPIVRTGRGRLQVYFRDPGNLAKRARDGFELRVGPHQCIAPPSEHPDTGLQYAWLLNRAPWEVPLAELPDQLLDYFASSVNGSAPTVGNAIPEGERNGTLASMAGTMRRRGASETEILAALKTMNAERCKPPLSAAEVERIAASVGRYPTQQKPGVAAAEPAASPDPGPLQLVPLDWRPIIEKGIPKIEYVSLPYLPARKRIWAVGPAEAGKSIYAAFVTAKLTRADKIVAYVSQENGLEEEVRRFLRLRARFENPVVRRPGPRSRARLACRRPHRSVAGGGSLSHRHAHGLLVR